MFKGVAQTRIEVKINTHSLYPFSQGFEHVRRSRTSPKRIHILSVLSHNGSSMFEGVEPPRTVEKNNTHFCALSHSGSSMFEGVKSTRTEVKTITHSLCPLSHFVEYIRRSRTSPKPIHILCVPSHSGSSMFEESNQPELR